MIAHAASAFPIVEKITAEIVNPIIKLLIAAAIVYFLWGVVEMITNLSDEKKLTAGKQHMIWGIVGLVIMTGVFGIINLICRTIGAC